jgi:hypothetical protein
LFLNETQELQDLWHEGGVLHVGVYEAAEVHVLDAHNPSHLQITTNHNRPLGGVRERDTHADAHAKLKPCATP